MENAKVNTDKSRSERSTSKIKTIERALNELHILTRRARIFLLEILGETDPPSKPEDKLLEEKERSLSIILEEIPEDIMSDVKKIESVFQDLREKLLT